MPLIDNREDQYVDYDAWDEVPEQDAGEGVESGTYSALSADVNLYEEPLILLSVSSHRFDITFLIH